MSYLAVFGVIGTMISLGYYLRFLLAIYRRPAGERAPAHASPGRVLAAPRCIVAAAVVLWLGVAPAPFVDIGAHAPPLRSSRRPLARSRSHEEAP